MSKKFYTLKNDKVFKNVFFRNDLFKWLLNRTLIDTDYKLNNIEFLNCELTKDRMYIRSKIVDILTKDIDNNYLYNIELNSIFDYEIIKRNYVYQCASIANIVHVNKNFNDDLNPVIQINYNFKSVIKEDNKKINRITDINIDTKKKYTFFKEIINIDIDDFIDEWYNLNKDKNYYEKYKHFLIIGMNKKDLIELEDDDIMVKKIKNEVIKLNNDSKFYQFLTDEEDKEILCNSYYSKGIKEGMNKGIEQGIEQGTINTNINNAKSMKRENIPFKKIQKITGLDSKTIASL